MSGQSAPVDVLIPASGTSSITMDGLAPVIGGGSTLACHPYGAPL